MRNAFLCVKWITFYYRIESYQRKLDEALAIVAVPCIRVGIDGAFEGCQVDLVAKQTTDATKTTAELVSFLRLVGNNFKRATKLFILLS